MGHAGTIPLRNIWLLFLYAADLVEFRDRFEGEIEPARDLPDLVGRLLTHVVEGRLRRNLSRGYRFQSAILSRVRGRIDMLTTVTGQLMERGQVACRFEDNTMDTARNRLVRAALERLAARIANPEVAHRCRALSGDLARLGVASARPSRAELAIDQIGRNETADRLMVSLARMVFDVVIPTETLGMNELQNSTPTEQILRRLFERAVGNALRLTLAPLGWSVLRGRRLGWPMASASPGIAAVFPGMQTDIEIVQNSTGRKIVIDTKFTNIFTASNYRSEILKSGYLYQMYAYLRTQEQPDDPQSQTSEGMLLHPQVGNAVDESVCVQGHIMRFKTIDLTAKPAEFECSLLGLL